MMAKISMVYPRKFRAHIARLLVYANVKRSEDEWLKVTTILSLIASTVLAIFSFIQFGISLPFILLIFILTFLSVMYLFYLSLLFAADSRIKDIERNLPDALEFVAGNVKAGLSLYSALKMIKYPEFGKLAEEFEKVKSKELERSLLKISEKTGSPNLRRTVRIIINGLKAGGYLGVLLESLAKDLRNMQTSKKEALANVSGYLFFIVFAVAIVCPLLLSVSLQFIKIFLQTKSSMLLPEKVGYMPKPPSFGIEPNVFETYSLIIILLSCFFASLVIGVLREGKESLGMRYFPILLIISLTTYLLSSHKIIPLLLKAIGVL